MIRDRQAVAVICGGNKNRQHDAEVGREPQYDVFADEFLDHAQGGFYNADYDRPACLALLGDVTASGSWTQRAARAFMPPN